MISIYRCQLINDQWQRIERLHLPHGFDSMAHAVEFAEARNRQTWAGFDWLQSPQEAYLAIRD